MHLVFLVNAPRGKNFSVDQFLEGRTELATVIGQSAAVRAAELPHGPHFHGVGSAVTRIKTMEPLGEIRSQKEPLLPLQLGPAGIEQCGQPGVELEEIGLVFLGVVEFVQQRAGISEISRTKMALHLKTDFHGRGGQSPEGILEPFAAGFAVAAANTLEESLGRELDVLPCRLMGSDMEGMGQHVEIALIQSPTGVVDVQAIDCGDGLPFDRFPSPPLDNAE